MQTIPVFAYLVVILVLFGFGPVAALVATVIYAMPPMVRITLLVLQNVSSEIKDFGTMCGCTTHQMTWRVLLPSARASLMAGVVAGCTRLQILTRIRLPLALPELLLGLNQTIMLAISVLVITALVGTRDLGQEVYIALTKADVGLALVAGLSIAFIAIIADRIITASARAARIRYGLEEQHG